MAKQLAPDPRLTGDALRDYCAGAVAPYFHPVGTCAMRRFAVVDAYARVRGFGNLCIADASIMPAILRATTQLPVLSAAEPIAERLRERH